MVLTALGLAGCGAWAARGAREGEALEFVRVERGRFVVDGEPYAFVGANLWYGMNLGSRGPGGDRERLGRELDRLRALGVTNLRVLGGSEGPASAPYRVVPPLQRAPGDYDEALLDGLDYLIAELGRRGQRAVVCLTNFWFWSGGVAQYLAWQGAGPIPYPLGPGGSWHDYQTYAARFYTDEGATGAFSRHVAFLLERVNPYTGRRYRDEPAIMAWELANEPRGMGEAEALRRWIDRTAAEIKALDPNHLVTTGCEGDTDLPAYHGVDFVADHAGPDVDYATVHLWVENWRWYDPAGGEGGYARAEARALDYLRSHAERARAVLGKPVVLEEFGLARDGGSFDPAAATTARDRYFARLLGEVRPEGPLQGASFWAWAGEGRPARPPGGRWSAGLAWTGDPPHEPQGWYGVYDRDEGTLAVIEAVARRLAAAVR